MNALNRSEILKKLKDQQNNIIFESDEDEAAAEYHGELQSVIDTIEGNLSDYEVKKAADWVGVSL